MPVVSLDSLSFTDSMDISFATKQTHRGHLLSLGMIKVNSLHCCKAVCLYSQSEISIIFPLCILTQIHHLQKTSSKT